MILAIDPGLRWCGCAVGDDSQLYRAELVLPIVKSSARGPAVWAYMAEGVLRWYNEHFTDPTIAPNLRVFLEVPRIYPQMDQRKGDLNDLIELAGVVGAIAGSFPVGTLNHYYPSDWKGQVPKKIMTERIRKKLSPQELDNMISVGAKDHNTLDAVGIFLHSCGRL